MLSALVNPQPPADPQERSASSARQDTNGSIGSGSVTLGDAVAAPGVSPLPRMVNPVLNMFAKPTPLDLSHISNAAFRQCVDKAMRPSFVKPSSRALEALANATRGRFADWGLEEEIAHHLRFAIQKAITADSWTSAMRACITMHHLLWEGGADFLEAAQRMDPSPGAEVVATFDSNMDGQGIKQRPVVIFIAGMLQFLLQLATSITFADIKHLNTRGFRLLKVTNSVASPPADGVSRNDTPIDVLMRCVSMQSYLTYLMSAQDLPLLAMDNEISVDVLDRAVADAKRIYKCLRRHIDLLSDERYHNIYEVAERDVSAWKQIFRSYASVTDRLINFFARLGELNVGQTESLEAPAAFDDEAATETLTRLVRERSQRMATRSVASYLQDHESSETKTSDSASTAREDPMPDDSDDSPVTTVGLTLPYARAPPGAVPHETSFKDGALTDNEEDTIGSSDRESSGPTFDQVSDDRYVIGNVLGKGAYGTVYRAFDAELGHFVAIKELQLQRSLDSSMEPLSELRKEFDVLKSAKHRHVVEVFALDVPVQGNPRIVMEWMPGGSVQSALKLTKRGFKENVVARYMKQALAGLAFLHARSVVHRDIKPANMLLSAEGTVKLSDFGTSRIVSGMANTMQTGTVVGTIPFLAPECFKGSYSPASDIWAIGCSALEMMTGQMPWSERGTKDTLSLVFIIGNATPPNHHPQLPEVASGASPLVPSVSGSVCGLMCGQGTITETAHDFLMQCFAFDYKERPTAAQLLNHPFLDV